MIIQTETQHYSLEEYLEFEIDSEERHEYLDGKIFSMTGGTPEHNEIASILNAILRVSLKGKPYSIFIADQRLWIPQRKLYTYPDVMVAHRPLELQTGRTDTITNPLLIAEVLSKSTKSYDRDEKFAAYRTIPSFQEYLLIDQYKYHVEQYVKTSDRQWIFSEYDGLEADFSLSSVSLEIALKDLYEGIKLGENESV
ncbi:MAG: Uma2 family endonuclease [Cyanobacteriota bacterium]|nr:Uma2 family endonuclease [Cyanobacteriota bacterium]